MNLELVFSFAPLIFSMIWILFMFVESMMPMMVTLLLSSLVLPMIWMDLHKLFWPCALFLILMATGLIVIFAYIVSLHEGGSKLSGMYVLGLAVSFIISVFAMWVRSPSILHSLNMKTDVDLLLSFILVYILLFLVISFVRLVYSKGGGFRKKF